MRPKKADLKPERVDLRADGGLKRRWLSHSLLPVMAAVAVRKKVVNIGHFSPSLCLQSLQIFLFC